MTSTWLLLSLFLSIAFAQYDCNKLQCWPCGAAQPVDYVFLVDGSDSMQPMMNEITQSLSALGEEVAARDVDATFTVIMFGYTCTQILPNIHLASEPELLLHMSSNISQLIDVFSRMQATSQQSPSGVANLHSAHGGAESSFEPLLMTLKLAGYPPGAGVQTFGSVSSYVGGAKSVGLRAGAKTVFIVAADEDEDAAYHSENETPGTQCMSPDPVTKNNGPSFDYFTSPWARQINDTVSRLLLRKERVSLYYFVNEGWGDGDVGDWTDSAKVYGKPTCDVSDADTLANFDAPATLSCLRSNGVGLSLQGQLLEGGAQIRLFDVNQLVGGQVSAASVMKEATAVAAQCTARRRRDVDAVATCFNYFCSEQKGCYKEPTCHEACYLQCMRDGVCVEDCSSPPSPPSLPTLPPTSKGDQGADAAAASSSSSTSSGLSALGFILIIVFAVLLLCCCLVAAAAYVLVSKRRATASMMGGAHGGGHRRSSRAVSLGRLDYSHRGTRAQSRGGSHGGSRSMSRKGSSERVGRSRGMSYNDATAIF